MDITEAKYHKDFKTKENISINCLIFGIKHSVPIAEGNRHYDEIMRQVNAGELTIADAE